MDNLFFKQPILNSPYESPIQHWELDEQGQPTQQIIAKRRRAEFITPIPQPKKQKGSASHKGNLFVIFGEPDIEICDAGNDQIQITIKGIDVFHPNSGEIRSDGTDGIACWFIDTDYNEESFFVRHAYFLGANNPYQSLKTTLKAEINEEAWATLNSDQSRPFDKPASGRIAVKVINHLGDEVMKVFLVKR